ncbi:general odorant-binding protein 68 [Drosophila nasuta]|uniref:General odorant-binding protein 68 n=1 Tax=Drosophila albomicans TaxID=7291 RepID=A0A6P8X7H9_DROAB|nr:general odorant-binding protein 68 [Drosophila albomicans]XP_060657614.1 general odorant-binding protein 68 [Drosophila nasuta]
MKVSILLLGLGQLLLLVSKKSSTAIRVHCRDVERIHEDHIHYCCKHPDGHNDVTEQCAKQTKFKLPSRDEEAIEDLTVDHVMTGTCFAKCVFDHYNFMDNDKLNMTAVRNHYQTTYKEDPEYVKEMISAFNLCHSKSEDATAEFLSTSIVRAFSSSAYSCKPMPSVVLACVIHRFFHNCPRNRWSNTTECVETLAFSKKCKDVLTTM